MRTGDYVYGRDGNPTLVLKAHDPYMPEKMYEVHFDCGAVVTVDASHLWHTYTSDDRTKLFHRTPEFRARRRANRPSRGIGKRPDLALRNSRDAVGYESEPVTGSVKTTQEIRDTLTVRGGSRINHSIPVCDPLEGGGEWPSDIDPYVLGAWLGDGTTKSGGFTLGENELVELISETEAGLRKLKAQYSYSVPGLMARLKEDGLYGNKHVPYWILHAPFTDRLAVFQGLMDTDGYAAKNGKLEFCVTHKPLAEGFRQLAASLGLKTSWRESDAKLYGRVTSTRYRIQFRAPFPVFRLKRKLERQNLDVRPSTRHHFITDVVEVEPAPVRCLTVSASDGLYLIGKELIPTHNTWSLLVDPLRYIHVAGFGGIIFRRNFAQVTKQGGLWDASMEIYPKDGAKPYGGKLWRWPNNNKIEFAHLQHEETKLDYQGSEIPFLGFDELQHFSESVFWYLMSRSRSTCGIAPYVRCTCQADSQSWVARLISWYWDQETGYPIKERAGVIRYFIRKDSEIIWGDTKDDLYETNGEWIREREQEQIQGGADPLNVKMIKSFTFIPASVFDNKILIRKDPGYVSNLHAQLPVDKERLLYGNWKISPTAGDLFDRDWFEILEEAPLGGTAVRFWDLAATATDLRDKGDGPSYTASVLLRKVKGLYYIEDAFQVRKGAAEVNELLKRTTEQDAQWAAKAKCNYKVRWEQEPGSASKRETARMKSELIHYDANGIRPQGDKYQRAVPVAVASKNGLVKVMEGDWNDTLLTHLHNQPDNPHNDLMDALSGAWVSVNKSGIFKLIKL